MRCRIALFPYLNMRPFDLVPLPAGVTCCQLEPMAMARAMASGEVDAAPVPVGAWPMLAGRVDPLANFGLAACRHAQSVLLFSRPELMALNPRHRLHLAPESASSVRLLFLLLQELLGPDNLPRPMALDQPADGELVMGDRALIRLQNPLYPNCYDLAGLWWERRRLPFTFARWVADRRLAPACRAALLAWLQACVEAFQRCPTPAPPLPAGLTPQAGQAYLSLFQYRLDQEALQGEQRFLQEMACQEQAFQRWISP